MSEEELEKFEVTDYDLENEFNINRPTRRISKKQQIYGVWADDSDEEVKPSTSRPSFKGSGGGKRNYTAPVSFISGGVHQPGKKKEELKNDEDDEEMEVDERVGFGGRRGNKGPVNSSSDEEEQEIRPQSSKFRQQFDQGMSIDGDIAGLRKKRAPVNPALMQKGVGHWEKHTKGIGAKLLLQMGYQPGKGLGKALQGIQAPVEAKLRKGRGAIGAYGPEVKQRLADTKADSEEEEAKEFVEKLSLWRKGDTDSKKKKVRYVYKSIGEVIEQGKTGKVKKDYSQLSKVKVIDMTGPQQRVLSGYHAIAGQQRPSDQWEIRKEKEFTNFALPELQHNLNLLMDMCEQDIIHNDRKLRHANDRIVALEHEEGTLTQTIDQQEKHINTLETVLAIVEKLMNSDRTQPLSLEETVQAFQELQEKYYEEYRMYEIGDLASILVGPKIKTLLATWSPLDNPHEHLELFRQWKHILETEQANSLSSISSQDPYHRLVWQALIPSIRQATSKWNVRSCEPMIELLEAWLPLLPCWVMDNIREQLVLPRITLEVDEWNPMTDTVPIHAWTHPWLPLLGNRLETTIYPVIRHKLSKALVNWHPSDRSARLMLLPWHKVFPKGDMDAFLVKNILPKLQLAMQELVINPHQQHLEQWNWVMEWEDLVPVICLASLLEKSFFPRWLQVLTMWLNHSPNYDEITNWYCGWKGMVSENLLLQPTVKEHFRKALDMMNRAVSAPSTSAPGGVESVSYLKNIEQTAAAAARPTERETARFQFLAEAVRTASQIPQGFKELIQKRCEERNIVFVPLVNRHREGKQVYRCGRVQVYFDRTVVFVSEDGGAWVPSSLEGLLDAAV